MARRVFLHVGTPKSGTSFLQAVAHENATVLAKQGLLVPLDREHHFQATLAVREAPPPGGGRTEVVAEGWRAVVEAVREWNGDALLTHELFAGATGEQAGRAVAVLAPADVHVIITARDLLRQIPAEWQEHVKHGDTVPLARFVDDVMQQRPGARWFWQVQDVVDLAQRWAQQVGRDHIHLVTVPPSGAPAQLLWHRFASVLAVDPATCSIEVARSNESLGAVEVEFLRRVHQQREGFFPAEGQHRWFKDRLAQRVLSGHPEPRKFGIGAVARQWATDRSSTMAAELAAAGYSVVGDLGDLVPPPTADPGALPEASEGELAAVGARAAVQLLAMVREEVEQRQRVSRDLAHARVELEELQDQVRRWRAHPARQLLIAHSETAPWLMRTRMAYRRFVDAGRALRSGPAGD